jgi:hypothetical protein
MKLGHGKFSWIATQNNHNASKTWNFPFTIYKLVMDYN